MIDIIKLINIQSYKEIVFQFSTEINVFDAPNETGKSVIFKVFRKMCDANWYGKSSRQDLIRRGCNSGLAAILLTPDKNDDRYMIVFRLYKTYQLYELYCNDELIETWKQDTIPDEVLKALGWFYDKDSKRLLNLCDQELDMPFVNGNSKSNYEAMRFIIHDDELDIARENLNDWSKELASELQRLSYVKSKYEWVLSSLKHVDTVELKNSIEKREAIEHVATVLAGLLKSLSSIGQLDKPRFDSIDSAHVESCIERSIEIHNLGKTLQDATLEHEPRFNRIDEAEMENLISSVKILNSLRFQLWDCLESIRSLRTAESSRDNVLELIQDFEEENKVCPLCGKLFNGEECCHE